eukprot:CCRYP_013112-RA/>CCRYP_013112-RA protein AED:0.07 eAED:0.07 QI:97/1/1/1/1/1/2/301/209
MKATILLNTAATILALSRPTDALTREEYHAGRLLEDGSRELMSFTVVFEECVDTNLDECLNEIQSSVAENPTIFENREALTPIIHKVRERTDPGYYKVVLVTNLAETGVVGIHGDGMVFYPFEWCIPNPSGEPECREIGPWDCDVGTPLTVEQCCNMIKASVPNADVEGNYLACHPQYPVGSVSNPIDYGRVSITTDAQGNVVHPPRNE